MSYNWGYSPPPVWNQSSLGAATPQIHYDPTTHLVPQRFPLSMCPMPPAMFTQLPAQFPPKERSSQLLVSSYPAAYPQTSGNFSTPAHGMLAIRQSVTGPIELNPAAWATNRFDSADVKNYRCSYCGQHKESSSGVRNKRTRIRCECGGPQQDGKTRMHSR